MADIHRLVRFVALTAAVVWFGLTVRAQAGQPAEPAGAGETESAARIIDGPANIRSFAPEESAVTVSAAEVNLRQVFEDLGPDATLWYQHVQTLANPFFEGRAPGTRGVELAAQYIEFYFRTYGLEPAFGAGGEQLGGPSDAAGESYRQPFDFSVRGRGVQVEITEAVLAINGPELAEGEDFIVLGNSGSGDVTAPLTFVGYGIDEGPDEYTSFDDDTDLSGRVALLLRYEPLDEDGASQWSTERFSRQAGIVRKFRSVADRGAAGILLVNPPGAVHGREGLEPIGRSRGFGPGLDIPAMQITPQVADRLLRDADALGRDLMTWRRLADTGEVKTVPLNDDVQVTMATAVQRKRDRRESEAENVGGILRGKGDLADQWIVIGAHFDHVGDGSLGGVNPRNRGRLHPGADDNASGTAGVLILARKLSEAYADAPDDANLRSVLFLTFGAEEMGLHGSRYFANNPTMPIESIGILLNMDMIGRLRSQNLSVLGTETAAGLSEILQPHFEASGLTVSVNPGGSGQSDDASFDRVEVPALHFFTGMHPEYTSPSDQAYTVNPAGAGAILDLMFDIAQDLATRPDQLVYQQPSAGRGRDRGYASVRLGIRPGMGEEAQTGVLVDAVSQDTSAADAGMIQGDIIVAWGDRPIEGLEDLFDQLQEHEPGDQVKITVLRDAKRVVLDVTLKSGDG
ncbi:MAG: M28 family peptidase [Planctomycetota bacterium]|nr:M28 family peptidase [Planctomycetota bacterium]